MPKKANGEPITDKSSLYYGKNMELKYLKFLLPCWKTKNGYRNFARFDNSAYVIYREHASSFSTLDDDQHHLETLLCYYITHTVYLSACDRMRTM